MTGSWSKAMAHVENMENNRSTLLKCINMSVQVVACLRAAGVLDEAKESRLEAVKAPYDKLSLIIDWLKESSFKIYESFLQVMEENEQQHVVNLLKGRKEDKHLPLSPDRYARLVHIRPKLMRMIHNNVDLIAALKSSSAISETDLDDLSADKGPNYKRNYRLINAILRRSDYSFECLHDALVSAHHQEAADYLDEGEVIAVHVKTTRPDLDEKLSESMNAALMRKSIDETAAKEIQTIEAMDETAVKDIQIPHINGLRVVGATPGHSIVILVYCKTTDNLVTFTQVFNSGELQTKLENILNRLFARIEPKSTEILKSSIRLDDEDILEIEDITGIEDWLLSVAAKSPQSAYHLDSKMPAEVEEKMTYEIISVKVRLHREVLDGLEMLIKHVKHPKLDASASKKRNKGKDETFRIRPKRIKSDVLADSLIISHDPDCAPATIERTSSWSSIPSSIGTYITDDDSGIYAGTSRRPNFDWHQDRQTFHMNLENLLGEEEELLTFFLPEEAIPDPGLNWKQRRTTLNNELPKMLKAQTYILESLIRATCTPDEQRLAAQDIYSRLQQQRQLWTKLKQQVLDEHREFIRSAYQSTYDAFIIKKIGLPWEDIRELNRKLMEAREKFGEAPEVFRVNLVRHRAFVELRMDPDHGLTDELQETEAIDYTEVQIISAEKVSFRKSRIILDIILEGNASDKIEKFREALRVTKQRHLVNYVEANGEYMARFAGEWPLGKRELNIIDKNVSFLKRNIDTSGGLLAEMRNRNTITERQKEFVSGEPNQYQRNTALFDIIRRNSLTEYMSTIDSLMKTNQEHIAEILRRGGMVVQIHSRTTAEVPIIKHGEAEIVERLMKAIQKKTPTEIDRILELARLKNLGLIDADVRE